MVISSQVYQVKSLSFKILFPFQPEFVLYSSLFFVHIFAVHIVVNFSFTCEKSALEEYKTQCEFLHLKHWNYVSESKYFLFIDAYVTFMKSKRFYRVTVNHIDGNKKWVSGNDYPTKRAPGQRYLIEPTNYYLEHFPMLLNTL